MKTLILSFFFLSFGIARGATMEPLNEIAESYVKLALQIGQYDADFVDAYYGPPEWKPKENTKAPETSDTYPRFLKQATALQGRLRSVPKTGMSALRLQRYEFLDSLLGSAVARMEVKSGRKLSFDEESRRTYGVVAPSYTIKSFESELKELDAALPGKGPLSERYNQFRKGFVVTPEKIKPLFEVALKEARKRTLKYITLPKNESFEMELLSTDAGWGAYNWYKGNAHSLIQINTKVPVYVDQMIIYASHEGYPGHHVQSILRDVHLYHENGWVEFSIGPLFCTSGILMEGGGDFGIEVAFPKDERLQFAKEVLYPMAGIDPSKAVEYARILKLREKLGNEVTIETAREFLDGKITKDEAIRRMQEYGLETKERAENRIRFFNHYGSYIINYSLGEEMVRNFVRERLGTKESTEGQFKILNELFSTPYIPSML